MGKVEKKVRERDFAAEKEKVYVTCAEIVADRSRKEKKDRLPLSVITAASGLPKSAVANALKWLKRKGLITSGAEQEGWFLVSVHPKKIEKFCWAHGIFKDVVGRGKTKRLICPICDRANLRAEGKVV